MTTWSCVYNPEDTTDCDKMMAERLPLPTEYQIPGSTQSVGRRRWLLFGDSTMNLLYHVSSLDELLDPNNNKDEKGSKYCPIKDIQCSTRTENTNEEVGKRPKMCALYDVMELEHRKEWVPPDHSNLVGPRNFGFLKPFCKDCGSCKTEYHVCSRIENVKVLGTDLVSTDDVNCKSGRQVYGGYLSQDFAKDVELQTDAYLYTQENYAAFIASTWNTPELLIDWGKPICVIRNGMHDIAFLTNENEEDFHKKYMDNVGWMLEQYQPVCEHIVWLGNTANGNEENTELYPRGRSRKQIGGWARRHGYMQTMANMKQMDNNVKNVIENLPENIQTKMSFIDVHEASLFSSHNDFLHMSKPWCQDLGNWLATFL